MPGRGLGALTVPAGTEGDRLVEPAREAPPDVLIGGADATALCEEGAEDVRAMFVGIVLSSRADPAKEDVLPCQVQGPYGVAPAAYPVVAELQNITEDETPSHGARFVGGVAPWAVVASAVATRAAAARAPTPPAASWVRAARGSGVLFRTSVVVVRGGAAVGPICAGRSPPVAIAMLAGARGAAAGRLSRTHHGGERPLNGGHPCVRTSVEVRRLRPIGRVDETGRRGARYAGSAEERSHARIAHVLRVGSRHM